MANDRELLEKAKAYFSQIRKADRLIQRLRDTANTLRAGLTSQSQELRSDRVQTSGAKDPLGETMVKIISLEEDIDRRVLELVQQKADALCRIRKTLDNDQQNILIARYVEGLEWRKIAVELHFSVRQVHRIHMAALLDFAKENPDILKDGTLCHIQM